MKKRIFALTLALCMMVSVMPNSFAAGILSVGDGTSTDTTVPSGGSILSVTGNTSTQLSNTGALQNSILSNGSSDGNNDDVPTSTVTTRGSSEPITYNTVQNNQPITVAEPTYVPVAQAEPVTNTGVDTSKKVEDLGNGKYNVELESFVTGTVTTSKQALDIVLVLDQSGSMANTFATEVSGYTKAGTWDQGKSIGSNSPKTGLSAWQNADAYFIDLNEGTGNAPYYQALETRQFSWPQGLNNQAFGYYNADGTWVWVLGHQSSNFLGANLDSVKNAVPAGDDYLIWQGKAFYTATTTGISRLDALKRAVTTFSNAVADNAAEFNVDHKLAIVGFASGDDNSSYDGNYTNTEIFIGSNQTRYDNCTNTTYSSALQDMTTKTGKDNITASIGALSAEGGTLVHHGLELATSILNASTEANRKQYVIVFTDGAPGWSGYDAKYANYAIDDAKTLKDNKTTIYTVSVMEGSSKPPANEVDRFMDYMSSDYPSATTVSAPGTAVDTKYYMVANDADGLTKVFEGISEDIATPAVNLGTTTVVQDAVTDYFDLPADTSAVTVYTVAKTANGWADKVKVYPNVPGSSIRVNFGSGNTVQVDGFDFSKEFVSSTPKPGTDSDYGKKLVVEFTISTKSDFLGGSNIPTNVQSNSGVFVDNKVIENFIADPASQNIAVKSVDPIVKSQTVYLSNQADLESLMNGFDSRINGINNDYVNITYCLYEKATEEGKEDTLIGYYTIVGNPTTTNDVPSEKFTWVGPTDPVLNKCKEYAIACTVTDSGDTSKKVDSDKLSATIHVLKPSAKFLDTTIYLGDTPNYDDNEATATTAKVTWSDTTEGEAEKGAWAAVTGDEPGMAFVCTPEGNFTDCTPVKVEIKIADAVAFESSFKVHVLKPTVTVQDSTIYLGETPDCDSENMSDSIDWSDETDDPSGEVIGRAPSVNVEFTEPADFTECRDIRIESVKLNGKGEYVDHTTVKNGSKDYFTVHVVEPRAEFQGSTIYLGYTPTQNDFETYNIKGETTWVHTKNDGAYVEDYDYPDVTFGFVAEDGEAYTDCAPITATVYSGGVANSQDEREFTVHVIRPTITFADQDIYLSQTPVYAAPSFAWDETCADECEGTLPENNSTDTEDMFSYSYDVDPGKFVLCTDVNVAVKIGTTDYTEYVTLKNTDGTTRNIDKTDKIDELEHEFTVHVYLPQVVLESQNLWADYDSEVTLTDGMKDAVISEWSNQCNSTEKKDHSSNAPQCSDPVYVFTLNGNVITTYNAKDEEVTDQSTIDVALDKIKIGGIEYEFSNVDAVAYTITVNKFDLTINKTWSGADVYKQDAIFTVSGGLGEFQVVLPKDESNVIVTGLLCGQDYTVTEDTNWTWRWKANVNADGKEIVTLNVTECGDHNVTTFNPHDTTDDKSNPDARGAKPIEFINSLFNRLWLSFCTTVKNIFAAITTTEGGN